MSFEIHTVRRGGGSSLRAALPAEGTDRYDPFLVLHEQGPVTYCPGRAVRLTDHPHRGFETVNYIIEGEQFHRDSHGHEGIISAGGMQWMTAVSGVIHAELPTPRLLNDGGAMHAFQFWLNLPRAMLSAMRIGEPVLSEGPFVMTTAAEISQAIADYRAGRFAATAAAP